MSSLHHRLYRWRGNMSANRSCFLSAVAGADGRSAAVLCEESIDATEAVVAEGVAIAEVHTSTVAVGMDTGAGVAACMDTVEAVVKLLGGESVLAHGASATCSPSVWPLPPPVSEDELELLSDSVVRWRLRRRELINVPSLNW
jgi:hypothetical protein